MSPLLASLLHSLWIGLVLWIATRIVLRTLPATSAEARHLVAVAAALLLFFGWGAAWMLHRSGAPSLATSEISGGGHVEVVAQADPAPVHATASQNESGQPAPDMKRPASLAERLATLRRAATVQTCLELAWLAGVAFGLARLAHGLHAGGARWLARQPAHTVPAAWLDAWQGALEEQARRLKTRLVAIEGAGAPFVVGLLEPVIVVPLARCAGVSPALARAALAHELAHVARKDWLVELGLRLVEAALFFNPFAWLLTAQVRQEREACCDAWACGNLEIPRVAFAEALAAWARLLMPVREPPANGLGLGRGLVDRVARLLESNATSRTRTWRGTVGVLALIAAGLAGYGAFLRWGASALRDAERVALLDQAAAPYIRPDPWIPQPRHEARPERIISGRIVTPEGAAVTGAEIRFWAGDARSESSAQSGNDGSFRSRRPLSGPTEIRIRADGYAMRRAYAEADEAELRTPIILSQGHDVPVRVLDEDGHPLPGALVHWAIDVFGPRKADQAFTDGDGLAVVRHLPADIPAYVRAEADGFATVGIGPFSAEELNGTTPAAIRLPRGRDVRLRVISEENDQPVAGATVRIDSIQPAWSPGSHPHPSWNYGGLKTNSSGEATLKYLRLDTSYALRVGTPGSDGLTVSLSAAPAAEQSVRIPAARQVTLELKGFPGQHRTTPLGLIVRVGSESRRHDIRLNPDGSARLALRLGGNRALSFEFADPRLENLNVKAANAGALGRTVVIDYATLPAEKQAAAMRRVAIKFMHGGKEFFPSGRFYIHRKASPHVWNADGFALEPGKPLFAEWADGTRLKLTAGWGLVGAVIDVPENSEDEIVVDEKLTEIRVPVKPAGLVRAQVRDAAGNLVRTPRLMGSTVHEIFSKRRMISFSGNSQLGEWQASEPVEFSFWGTPLWAADGLVFARGPSVSVSARNPVADVVISLPETRSYEFSVTDESGRKLAGVACTLTGRFFGPKDVNPPFGLITRTSDADGRVRFEAGVDFTEWKGLELLIEARRSGYARLATSIAAEKLAGIPSIGMKPAIQFRARLVNRETGAGVAGIEVEIHDGNPVRFSQNKTVSDLEGWIEFNDLAAGQTFRLGYGIPRALGLRLAQDKEMWRELTPADTGFIVYLDKE